MARRMWHRLICCDMQEGEEIRQKNEGKWWFTFQDSVDGSAVELDVEIGRYMDTSLVRADVQPSFVRLLIKVWTWQNVTARHYLWLCHFSFHIHSTAYPYLRAVLRCLQARPWTAVSAQHLHKQLMMPMAPFSDTTSSINA